MLEIYDVGGRLVRRLIGAEQPAGEYAVNWNGRNARGEMVSTGIYFYRLQAGSVVQTRKMLLLK